MWIFSPWSGLGGGGARLVTVIFLECLGVLSSLSVAVAVLDFFCTSGGGGAFLLLFWATGGVSSPRLFGGGVARWMPGDRLLCRTGDGWSTSSVPSLLEAAILSFSCFMTPAVNCCGLNTLGGGGALVMRGFKVPYKIHMQESRKFIFSAMITYLWLTVSRFLSLVMFRTGWHFYRQNKQEQININ